MPLFVRPNDARAGALVEGNNLKHDKRQHNKCRYLGAAARGQPGRQGMVRFLPQADLSDHPIGGEAGQAIGANAGNATGATDSNLLDELQALLDRLGAAKISLTLYLIEFGGLPHRLAKPLLQEAAGSCAMLRLPAPGQYLVIYLGPEPSPEAGGFLGRLGRGLAKLAPAAMPECAWAEVRMLRRCNHDIAAPAYLLLDLNAAAPRVVGITDW